MARPNKTGLDYYNIDVSVFQNRKVRRLIKTFGGKGYMIFSYVLTEIYRDKGCFLVWDSNTAFDVSDTLNVSENLVKEVINHCCVVGLFNKELLDNEGVITSKNIQERWEKISKEANRNICKVEDLCPQYNLTMEVKNSFLGKKSSLKGKKPHICIEEIPQRKVNKNIYNTNTRACMREENFENEDLNNSSNQDAQSEKEITAWQVFNQNSLELSDWFVSRWKAGKKYYKVGAVGKIVINGINRINLQEIAKEFTQEQINVALNGLFMQKTIYKEFTLTPFKFLQMEHFQRFYQAGLNGTQVFEDKKKYKAGALRSVGDL